MFAPSDVATLPPWRAALDRFVSELHNLYGERLHSVLLYGSRARGDAEEASDVDTLVVLDPVGEFWTELGRVSPIPSRISLEYDVVISAFPLDLRDYRSGRSPLLLNARREGVEVG